MLHAVNDFFLEVLNALHKSHEEIFPDKRKELDDVRKSYQIFRSLRRTSDTRALEIKEDGLVIDLVNNCVN